MDRYTYHTDYAPKGIKENNLEELIEEAKLESYRDGAPVYVLQIVAKVEAELPKFTSTVEIVANIDNNNLIIDGNK